MCAHGRAADHAALMLTNPRARPGPCVARPHAVPAPPWCSLDIAPPRQVGLAQPRHHSPTRLAPLLLPPPQVQQARLLRAHVPPPTFIASYPARPGPAGALSLEGLDGLLSWAGP